MLEGEALEHQRQRGCRAAPHQVAHPAAQLRRAQLAGVDHGGDLAQVGQQLAFEFDRVDQRAPASMPGRLAPRRCCGRASTAGAGGASRRSAAPARRCWRRGTPTRIVTPSLRSCVDQRQQVAAASRRCARRPRWPRGASRRSCSRRRKSRSSSGGRLSTQKKPASSSACSATDLPEPEMPVTSTTSLRAVGSAAPAAVSFAHGLRGAGPRHRASPGRARGWCSTSVSPPSMRAISATRASPATRLHVAHAWPGPAGALLTTKWWSAQAATCARCVTASTWRSRPSCFISRPRCRPRCRRHRRRSRRRSASARRRCAAVAAGCVVTAMASARRDSSPPEATLASGRGVLPAWPATRNSAASSPKACGSSCGSSATSKRAAGHAQLLHRLRHRGAPAWARPSGARGWSSCASSRHRRSASAAARSRPSRSAAASSACSSSCQPCQQRRQLGRRRGGSGVPATPRPTAASSSAAQALGVGFAVAQVAVQRVRRVFQLRLRALQHLDDGSEFGVEAQHVVECVDGAAGQRVGRRFGIGQGVERGTCTVEQRLAVGQALVFGVRARPTRRRRVPACRPRRSARPAARVRAPARRAGRVRCPARPAPCARPASVRPAGPGRCRPARRAARAPQPAASGSARHAGRGCRPGGRPPRAAAPRWPGCR